MHLGLIICHPIGFKGRHRGVFMGFWEVVVHKLKALPQLEERSHWTHDSTKYGEQLMKNRNRCGEDQMQGTRKGGIWML